MARSEQSRQQSRVRWRFVPTLVMCALLIEVAQAVRMLPQPQRRLQAYRDATGTPCHAPPVKSFLVSDGTWVDCIPVEGQMAAHHPALQDHVIQMPAPSASSRGSGHHPQLFAREHGGCPDGSIPVLRVDPFEHALPKSRSPVTALASTDAEEAAPHEYAVAGVPETTLPSYTGTQTIMSVHGPELGDPARDFSLSQLWIVDGETTDNSLSTIEVGWQKYPYLYEDLDAPHLFIFWTRDNYLSSGMNNGTTGSCYNVKGCAGFVQTNTNWVIGGAMPAYTTLDQNATQAVEVGIRVDFDPTDANWHLFLDEEDIGYWPSPIFNGTLQGAAAAVQWGGEVVFYTDASTIAHSNTTMGSGALPSAGYPEAAYHRNITVADESFTHHKPAKAELITIVTKPPCYDIAIYEDDESLWFFFGGPGGNDPACAPLV